MSLILEGGTRLGKTLWARSIASHNYFHGWTDLSNYSNDARYNVIDNIEFKHCKNKKELLGSKQNWTANVKYGKPIKIEGGIPTIVLCNPDVMGHRNEPIIL
ncbi:hypothetical protein I3760_13G132100 [Carya illinoinensis]|uniref:Replication-associated protein n=1 Tax=Carya illinoinensis TaxID=32201 RepID=A0A8T1NQ10_CARIL|nr:hypothetical protein I3760_13G132100 [Carya illinoinensis]KAG6632068.1 hypothetical protein CIPAW_13G133300 [Carya illinoinensis]KAG6682294.1 hypothetical protein I3842_13G132200 [Carya illinoinensis]